ncbi:unknown protein (plasmid) [Simkania negevensis Z]|uniref:Uncharacterized protein n=1 Tax=Simkania negevensis (strain ATCC VR-1471 / DSM 27360 / Z) TaxID=331113 RepID=F8L2U6_SIMNZ|nr:unknown protein [Simkania negevensis Z]
MLLVIINLKITDNQIISFVLAVYFNDFADIEQIVFG